MRFFPARAYDTGFGVKINPEMLKIIRIVQELCHGKENCSLEPKTVAIDIQNKIKSIGSRVRFGLTNWSSVRTCYEGLLCVLCMQSLRNCASDRLQGITCVD